MPSTSTSDDIPATARWTEVLDVPVDLLGKGGVEAWVREHLANSDACAHIATTNPEYIMIARRDPDFAAALREADLSTIDGAGLAVAVRLLKPASGATRVTGVDLTWLLARVSVDTGDGIFLLGANPGIADKAADRMRAAYPGAHVPGTWAHGSPSPRDDTGSIRRIVESGATIVLVAYGAPNQVHWIARNRAALADAGVRLAIGVGGALDYVSGETRWAPPLVRKLGLEWAWRLAREPWRWRRQLVLPMFAALVLRDAVRQRRARFRRR